MSTLVLATVAMKRMVLLLLVLCALVAVRASPISVILAHTSLAMRPTPQRCALASVAPEGHAPVRRGIETRAAVLAWRRLALVLEHADASTARFARDRAALVRECTRILPRSMPEGQDRVGANVVKRLLRLARIRGAFAVRVRGNPTRVVCAGVAESAHEALSADAPERIAADVVFASPVHTGRCGTMVGHVAVRWAPGEFGDA